MTEKRQTSKIFVGGLSWETTDQRLRTYFENYGAVSEAFVSFDRTTGESFGLILPQHPFETLPLDFVHLRLRGSAR